MLKAAYRRKMQNQGKKWEVTAGTNSRCSKLHGDETRLWEMTAMEMERSQKLLREISVWAQTVVTLVAELAEEQFEESEDLDSSLRAYSTPCFSMACIKAIVFLKGRIQHGHKHQGVKKGDKNSTRAQKRQGTKWFSSPSSKALFQEGT